MGHSERRQYFCETDADVLKKTQAAIAAGLTPDRLCGRAPGRAQSRQDRRSVGAAVRGRICRPDRRTVRQIALAYEPVWAIGTGQTATPEIASEAHKFDPIGSGQALRRRGRRQLRILYGGSVKPDNIEGLMQEAEIDGALVGGASLDPESFAKIVRGVLIIVSFPGARVFPGQIEGILMHSFADARMERLRQRDTSIAELDCECDRPSGTPRANARFAVLPAGSSALRGLQRPGMHTQQTDGRLSVPGLAEKLLTAAPAISRSSWVA